jgi:CubicO group peptidase (beta-lactamase class C family)
MPSAFTTEGLSRFGEVAASHVGEDRIPGLVALAARGDDVHVEALGTLGVGGARVRRDSLFRIASTTKPITAAATLVLAEEGLLDLDEPVGRLLPELAAPRVLQRMDGPLDDTVDAERPITVRHLLTFTGGFGMAVEMFSAVEPWPVVAAADPPAGRWSRPPAFPDRTAPPASSRPSTTCWRSPG